MRLDRDPKRLGGARKGFVQGRHWSVTQESRCEQVHVDPPETSATFREEPAGVHQRHAVPERRLGIGRRFALEFAASMGVGAFTAGWAADEDGTWPGNHSP